MGDARGHTPGTGALGARRPRRGRGRRAPSPRTSAGRRTAARARRPRSRTGRAGASAPACRARRPAAGRSCPGGWSGPAGGRQGPPAPARGTCRGARRQGRRCRSAGRRGRPVRGGDGGRPGCRGTAPRRSVVRRRGPAGRAGRPRPRGAQASARSGASTPGGVGSTGAPRRAALARRVSSVHAISAAFCSASFLLRPIPSPSTSSPTTAPGGEDLLVVRALLGDAVLRDTERGRGGELLQAGLPVEAGAEGGRAAHQRVEQVVHERGGRGQPARQVDGADAPPRWCRPGSRPCPGRRCSPRRGRAGGTPRGRACVRRRPGRAC